MNFRYSISGFTANQVYGDSSVAPLLQNDDRRAGSRWND